MPTLQLYLLGALDIRCDDQPLEKPPTLKSQSLLAYLILRRQRPQPRARLASLFWGDRPESKARSSLSTSLWHIRRCLPDERLILSNPHTVQFDPQADLWFDIEAFESYASRDDIAGLQAAATLYRGDFLDGFYDDWIFTERYRLETLFSETLARLMIGLEANGEHSAALSTALRLLPRDPLREDAHRVAMRAYCHLGQRSAALEQYHRCREVLEQELGAEPMAETTELHQAILDGRFSIGRVPRALPVATPTIPAGRSPLDVIASSPFVGREQEMVFLHQCWQEAVSRAGRGTEARQGGLVLISGEAGVGKTRLVKEFANQLRWQGMRVLWGRCYEFERGLPYQPIAEALRTALPTLAADELKVVPDWALGEVARLVPEMLEKLALSPAEERSGREVTPSVPPSQEPARLFDGVDRFLTEMSSHGALLIALEDLHWASESTLQLVHCLVRHLAHHPVLMISTFRPEAVGQKHHLLALQRELKHEGLCQPLRLDRLSPEAVEATVYEMSGAGGVVLPLAGRLYRETEGNPFFLIEIIKALFEANVVRLEEGTWRGDFAQISKGELPLPLGVSEAIQARVHNLAENTQEALRLAAILGREFDFDLLDAFWGRGQEATLEALDDLLRHRLINEGTGTLDRDYVFTHHKIREVIYATIPRRRRQHLHAQAGMAMESLYGPEMEELVSELAFHFHQGQQLDKTLTNKAIDYLHQAGEKAMRVSAHEEAIAHFSRGLASLQTLPDTPERARQELSLQLALGVALQATRGYAAPQVGRAYARAWELCQQMGETPQLFSALRLLGSYYGSRGEFQTSREIGELLLNLVEQVQVPLLVVAARLMLGWSMLFLGELTEAQEHLERAIASYDPQQHQAIAFTYGFEHSVACLSFASWALWVLGYPDQALKRSQEALALAQELAHPLSQAFAQSCAALFHGFRRDAQLAQELVEACIHISTEHGFPFWKASVMLLHGWALFEQGQTEEGLAQMHQGIAAYQATGTEMGRPHQLALLAEVYGKMGQTGKGLTALAEGLTIVNRTGERLFEAEAHRLKGELLRAECVQGVDAAQVEPHYRDAEACFQHAIEVARHQQTKSWELRAVTSLCRLWQEQGKRKEARQMLMEIYEWFTEGFDTPDLKEAKALLDELS